MSQQETHTLNNSKKPDYDGCLYIVATPIGNLEDMSLRAIRVLKEVALIASEDTRVTRKLLSHFHINKPLFSCYKDNEQTRVKKIIHELSEGRDVALVSDAGTPGISDPGAVLVREIRSAGYRVVPIPGPSALTAILSIAGLDIDPVLFIGFLPPKSGQRKKIITGFRAVNAHTVFYESPRRIIACLQDCLTVLGDRSVLLGRELTKIHEEILQGSISDILEILKDRDSIKGEFVVVIKASAPRDLPDYDSIDELLLWYRDNSGLSLKDSVKELAVNLDLPKTTVYQHALRIWGK